MGAVDWIDETRGRNRRERRADIPVPEALPALIAEDRKTLLRRWVRNDATRRQRSTLIQDAGTTGIELADALCAWLLLEGWIIRCERLSGGAWQWDALIWRDLPRLQALLGVVGPGRRAETRQALIMQTRDWLQTWRTTAMAPDPDLLDELEQALEQLAEERSLPPERLARRLDLLRALAAWHDEGACGTRRDFALHAGDGTKALSGADWRWLESGFDLERLRITRFASMAWLAGDITLGWPEAQTMPLGHLHCIGLPLTDLDRITCATTPQRWWLIENRASFERQAHILESGTALLWMPGRPSTDWLVTIERLLRLAPAPAWISADADPSGVDIACTVGALWESRGLAWTPHRMGVDEWHTTPQRWPLNTHDHQMLERLLARPRLPDELRVLCLAMQAEGRKAEQEAWL